MTEDHEPQSQKWTIGDTFAVAFLIAFMFFLVVWIAYAMTEI